MEKVDQEDVKERKLELEVVKKKMMKKKIDLIMFLPLIFRYYCSSFFKMKLIFKALSIFIIFNYIFLKN